MIKSVCLIGHGRVGGSLREALAARGYDVEWCHADDEPSAADACVVSVPDRYVAGVVERLSGYRLIAHTSGSLGLEVFGGRPEGAVLYPMQTFTTGRSVDWRLVPLFVEAGSDETLRLVTEFACSLSEHVTPLDAERRRLLHVAAVMSCNFVNHCVDMADTQLREIGLDWRTMLPLLDETVAKLHAMAPSEAQTGPAVRGDRAIIEAHKALIGDSDTRDIYDKMSENIIKYYGRKQTN